MEEFVAVEEYVGWWQCIEVCTKNMACAEVRRLSEQNGKLYRIKAKS